MATLIWITGLAGSGKSTLASEVYAKLKNRYPETLLVDGDHFREIIGDEIGYDNNGRLINAWRIVRMCKFLYDQGINVVCATMSLYKEIHEYNRKNFKNYFEIFVDTHMDELVRRDQKNLYSRALKGEILNVIGVDQPFDKPSMPDLVLKNLKREQIATEAEVIINQALHTNK